MRKHWLVGIVSVLLTLAISGCVSTGGSQKETIDASVNPCWSVRAVNDEIMVAVSPVRQTLQIAGSAGTVIGTAVSAIANEGYRKAIRETLEGYDAKGIFEERLEARLDEAVRADLVRVPAFGTKAGYATMRDAQAARYEGLNKRGRDLLLDLTISYGIFGYDGTLIAKIEGKLIDLDTGHARWRNTLMVASRAKLASDRLYDPTDRLTPSLTSPRLTIAENAIEQWTGDGGETFRKRYEQAVDGVIAALLADLGLAGDPEGFHYLGLHYMNRKKFEAAEELFRKAIVLRPDMLDARNALSVNLSHDGRLDEAIEMARAIAGEDPDYYPARYNLAYWYALKRGEPDEARPHYDRVLELGYARDKKIDKALGLDE